MCFFGDGTTNIGAFHEALNLAAIWKLPVVFVCENNLYMEYTPISAVTAVEHPAADRAAAYGLASRSSSTETTPTRCTRWRRRRIARARRGEGPSLDRGEDLPPRRPLPGRSREVPPRRRAGGVDAPRDPLVSYRERLLAAGTDAAELDGIDAEVAAEVDRATEEAKASPPSDAGLSCRTSGRTAVRPGGTDPGGGEGPARAPPRGRYVGVPGTTIALPDRGGREEVTRMTTAIDGSAAALLREIPTDCYIGGKWVEAGDGARVAVANPATGETLVSVADATVNDALRAVEVAHDALPAWSARPPRERGEVLRRAFELMTRRRRGARRAHRARERQGARATRAARWPTPRSSSAGTPRKRCANTGEFATAPSGANRILVRAPADRRRAARSRRGTSRPRC